MIESEVRKALRTVAADVMSQMEPTLAKMRRDLAEVEHRIEEMERPVEPDASSYFVQQRARRHEQAAAEAEAARNEIERDFWARVAARPLLDHAFGPVGMEEFER